MAIYSNSYILILRSFNFDNHVILMAKNKGIFPQNQPVWPTYLK